MNYMAAYMRNRCAKDLAGTFEALESSGKAVRKPTQLVRKSTVVFLRPVGAVVFIRGLLGGQEHYSRNLLDSSFLRHL